MRLQADMVFAGGRAVSDRVVSIADGRITAVEPASYPCSTRLDREGIYLGAAFAFAEMLLHGATTCVDFFYLQDNGNENAEAVIRAARDASSACWARG